MGTLTRDELNKTKLKPPSNVSKNIYRALEDLPNLFGKITKKGMKIVHLIFIISGWEGVELNEK